MHTLDSSLPELDSYVSYLGDMVVTSLKYLSPTSGGTVLDKPEADKGTSTYLLFKFLLVV
uniref:Uncharacterized protein n=1 Tax=Arion vulgaris TaxID=1028688 RepID=A0A0B6ZHM5_9EUPU